MAQSSFPLVVKGVPVCSRFFGLIGIELHSQSKDKVVNENLMNKPLTVNGYTDN